ncbi:MAG: IgGFc-binding protein, partial [Polaribacter sp.]
MRYKHLIFLLFISLGSSIFAQLSKTHYIPPLTSSDGFTDQYIYISTPKNSNVSYKITAIGQPDLAQYSGVVSNGNPVEQAVLDNGGAPIFFGETQLHVSDTNISITQKFTDKGFIVEASDVIYVSVRVRSSGGQFHAGALVSKGSAAPGTRFRIGGFVREINPANAHSTFASIMALEDNTTVDLSDLPSGATYPTGTPIPTSVVLNENETFVVVARATMDPRDIIGKLITSDKPIVVNSGSTQGSFGNSNGQDYGFDQIVGADKIGTEYITVKGDGANSIENVLIIADENNTEIFINGSSVSTINAGERFVAEGTFYNANGNMYINTSKNVFVYQGIGQSGSTVGAADANQSLFFVPPLSCE